MAVNGGCVEEMGNVLNGNMLIIVVVVGWVKVEYNIISLHRQQQQ